MGTLEGVMKKTAMILIFVAALAASTQALSLDLEWPLFLARYGKQYSTSEVDIRKSIFLDNLKYIERHNAEHALGLHTFSLGINQFADLTQDEFAKALATNGYRQTKQMGHNPTSINPKMDEPDSIDWRTKGAVTGVKNQGHCGSCWSFSATGVMEGAYFLSSGKLDTFSEQDLMDCGWGTAGVACLGGNPYAALNFVMKRGGACLEEEYPYEGVQGICRYDNNPLWNPKQHILPVANVGKVTKGDEGGLKSAVAQYGPVSVGIDAGHHSFQLYQDGVYRDPECSDIYLNHAVLAVGYGSTDDQDAYWIVKNSWGATWGESGYVKMARDDGNMCGVATDPTWAQ